MIYKLFSSSPRLGYHAGKPIESVVYCLNKSARHCWNYSLTVKNFMNDSEHILFADYAQFILISRGENKGRFQNIKYGITFLVLTTFQKLKN